MIKNFDLYSRLKASCIHLAISVLVATLAASLVFGLWYPSPYRIVSGGQSLFLIIISVDLILGPLLTFVAFNRIKTREHLIRDLAIIVVLQLLGLGYGLYTVFLARPVALVFEVDRFRVISYVDVLEVELPKAPKEFQSLSLTGPVLISIRESSDGEEKLKALEMALQGVDTSARPSYWQSYQANRKMVLERSRPASLMLKHYSAQAKEIEGSITKMGRNSEQVKFLPLMARESNWSVLVDASTAEIVGFVPYDGFF